MWSIPRAVGILVPRPCSERFQREVRTSFHRLSSERKMLLLSRVATSCQLVQFCHTLACFRSAYLGEFNQRDYFQNGPQYRNRMYNWLVAMRL